MNNFKKISAIILAVCTAATLFASCESDKKSDVEPTVIKSDVITEIVTEKEEIAVEVTDKKGEVSVSVSEKIVTIPVTKIVTEIATKSSVSSKVSSVINQVTTVAATSSQQKTSAAKKPSATTVRVPATTTTKKSESKTTSVPKTTVAATKRPVVDDKINEKAVGIFLLTKSDPVQLGNQATVIIQGTPGKTYSIDFYEAPSKPSSLSALEDKKADENGFISWTFEIGSSCSLGKRKIVIKEKNSSNYLETSITVI